jgi:capsular polysaccharide biosynthesis protein
MEQERYLQHEDELDIKELLYVIKKRLPLILIIPIICAGVAAGISIFATKPIYRADLSIIISKGEGNILTASDVSLYQSLIKTYTEIAKSAIVAERAVRDDHLKTSAGALQSSLSVVSQSETQILKMTVISGEPEDAVQKVEAVAEAFLIESRRLLPSGNAEIMDHAKTPRVPINSSKVKNIIIAYASGLLATIVLAFLLEYMNDTIKSEEDVERAFDIPILGVIPKHM